MTDLCVAALSQRIRFCGEVWGGCGSTTTELQSAVICQCCFTWLKTVDGLVALLQTCKSWRKAAQTQIKRRDGIHGVLSPSCVETLSLLSASQRSALLRVLAVCSTKSLCVNFSLTRRPSNLQRLGAQFGRELFSYMPHASDLTVNLGDWDLPLGGFAVELCRLIARSQQELKSLELRGGVLHQKMRAFLASGWNVASTFKLSTTGFSGLNHRSRGTDSSRGNNDSFTRREDGGVQTSGDTESVWGSDDPDCSSDSDDHLSDVVEILQESAEAQAHGGSGQTPGSATQPTPIKKGYKRLQFFLPNLKRLVVEGFQLLQFFEAPQLREHCVILADDMLQIPGRYQSEEKVFRDLQQPSSLSARGSNCQGHPHRYWGQGVSFIHPCLAVRFATLNGKQLRVMKVCGFASSVVKTGIFRWIRRSLLAASSVSESEGSAAHGERYGPAAACRAVFSGTGDLQCHECATLGQLETSADAWRDCARTPVLENLRVDDMALLVFVAPSTLQELEVSICNSGDWQLLLLFLQLYGQNLRSLTVWAEDSQPAWLSVSGASEGLVGCSVSPETQLLLDFLRHLHKSTAHAAAGGEAPEKGLSKASSASGKLPHLENLTGPCCLLSELDHPSNALPALKHLDTWGDRSRLVSFLQKQRKQHLKTLRVRGLARSETCGWPEEGLSNLDCPPVSSPPVHGGLHRLRTASVAAESEAAELLDYIGPGSLLKPYLRCPLLKRIQVSRSQAPACRCTQFA